MSAPQQQPNFLRIRSQTAKSLILSSAIVLFFLADSVNAYWRNDLDGHPKFSIFFRAIFEGGALIWMVFHQKHREISQKYLILILTLASCFIIGFGSFQIAFPQARLISSISYFNKYIFVFIVFVFARCTLIESSASQRTVIYRVYEWIVACNSISVISGAILSIQWLRSYPTSDRFGYRGLIPAVNEASLFWFIAVFYGITVYKEEKRLFPLIISLPACFLVGSKAALIFPSAILFVFIFRSRRTLIVKSVPLFALIAFILAWKNYDSITQWISELSILAYFVYRAEAGAGVITLLLSGRDALINNAILNISHWGWINWLFGGQDVETYLVEMDILDVPLFFGVVGGVLYGLGYYLILRDIKTQYRNVFIIPFVAMACLGGHVLASAVNTLYLCLFVIRVSKDTPNTRLSQKSPPPQAHEIN